MVYFFLVMGNFSFPKHRKLKSKKRFQFVYTHAKSKVNSWSALYYAPAEDLKIGFAAGKRLGCAFVRNHVKRMMREAFRLHQQEIKPGYHLVWVARNKLIRANLEIYVKTLLTLCREADILIESENG